MTQATTIKGGKVKVLLGSGSDPIVYAAACGLTERSITITKGLEEVDIPDCDDPDKVDWVGRDATSLSMAISGEGVLASEAVEVWLDAVESSDSTPVKVEWEFPAKTITYTGYMHVETVETPAARRGRARVNVSMQSDGEMVRVVT